MDYEEFWVRVVNTTDNAALLEFQDYDDKQIWIPFSQIEDNGEDIEEDAEIRVYLTQWIAEKKGLI